MFKGRSPLDIMVLVFTFTVSAAILFAGASIAIIKITNPDVDTSQSVDAITQVITGMVGALLGLMAGRGEAASPPSQPPPPPPPPPELPPAPRTRKRTTG